MINSKYEITDKLRFNVLEPLLVIPDPPSANWRRRKSGIQ